VRPRQAPDHESGDLRARRLGIEVTDAAIAHLRRRHHDDLARTGWIGENFLVFAHSGVDADLTDSGSWSPESTTAGAAPVFEDELSDCGTSRGR
jgi:hypothetical protein